jgi:hypothetical protein
MIHTITLNPCPQRVTIENIFNSSARVPIVLTVPELFKSPEIPLRPKANS